MSNEIEYTCEPAKKPTHFRHHFGEFHDLMRAPERKHIRDYRRVDNYHERNFMIFGSGIKPRYFCMTCRTNQCRLFKDHEIIEINPFTRIPRQTASKTRWKQFYADLRRWHNRQCKPPEDIS